MSLDDKTIAFDEWFHVPDFTPPYPDERAALIDGTKPLSVYTFSDRSRMDKDECEHLTSFAEEITYSGLCTTITVSKRLECTLMFACYPRNLWRVSAFMELDESTKNGPWSDALERQRSRLLGYSDENIDEWIKGHRSSVAKWHHATVHVVTPVDARDIAKKRGWTGPTLETLRPVSIVFSYSPVWPQKEAGSGSQLLCRFAIGWPDARSLFPTAVTGPAHVESPPNRATMDALDLARRSPIQWFIDGEWIE